VKGTGKGYGMTIRHLALGLGMTVILLGLTLQLNSFKLGLNKFNININIIKNIIIFIIINIINIIINKFEKILLILKNNRRFHLMSKIKNYYYYH
jgi:hypothetical protein